MTLADIQVPTEEIRVGKTSFTVRGISFLDVSLLIQDNRAEMDRMIDLFAALKEGGGSPEQFLKQLLSALPDLVAVIVAHASDSADVKKAAAGFKRLPVPVQLQAAMAVGRLTFEETGGVKKFVEQLVGLLGSANEVIPDLLDSQSSPAGQTSQ